MAVSFSPLPTGAQLVYVDGQLVGQYYQECGLALTQEVSEESLAQIEAEVSHQFGGPLGKVARPPDAAAIARERGEVDEGDA